MSEEKKEYCPQCGRELKEIKGFAKESVVKPIKACPRGCVSQR